MEHLIDMKHKKNTFNQRRTTNVLQYYLTERKDTVCLKQAFKQARLDMMLRNLPEFRQTFTW